MGVIYVCLFCDEIHHPDLADDGHHYEMTDCTNCGCDDLIELEETPEELDFERGVKNDCRL